MIARPASSITHRTSIKSYHRNSKKVRKGINDSEEKRDEEIHVFRALEHSQNRRKISKRCCTPHTHSEPKPFYRPDFLLYVRCHGQLFKQNVCLYGEFELTTIFSENGIYYSHQNKSQSPCLSLILEPTYKHFLQRKSHLKFQPIPAWIQIL